MTREMVYKAFASRASSRHPPKSATWVATGVALGAIRDSRIAPSEVAIYDLGPGPEDWHRRQSEAERLDSTAPTASPFGAGLCRTAPSGSIHARHSHRVRADTVGLKGVMGAWSDPAKLMVV